MSYAPIVLFVYNRPAHTKSTLDALLADPLASKSELFIFSDGAKPGAEEKVAEVRKLLGGISGFAKVHIRERPKNVGLGESIVGGVSEVLESYGRAIVLEDDLLIVPGFLRFMNESLERYHDDSRLFAISGWAPSIALPASYSSEVYLAPRALCWGWATWRDRWKKVDWKVEDYSQFSRDKRAQNEFAKGGDDLPDMLRHAMKGTVQSWAIRWAFAQFRLKMFSLVPVRSFVDNVGQDDSGTNSKERFQLQPAVLANTDWQVRFPNSLNVDDNVQSAFAKYYGYNWKAKVKKALGLL